MTHDPKTGKQERQWMTFPASRDPYGHGKIPFSTLFSVQSKSEMST